jgi:exoribonuclease R
VFAGTIAAVVPFGVFVALDEVYVEGLVHVPSLAKITSNTTVPSTRSSASAAADAFVSVTACR